MQKHVKEPAPRLSQRIPAGRRLPVPLLRLIHQCLEKDPDARPSSVLEILSILRALSRDEEEEASGVLESMGARPRSKARRTWLVGLVAASVGAGAALTALSIFAPEPSPGRPSVPALEEPAPEKEHKGSIVVETTPSGAVLYLEGEKAGTAPLQIDLLEGEHSLEVRAEGHKPKVVPVGIERDRRTRVHVVLERVE